VNVVVVTKIRWRKGGNTSGKIHRMNKPRDIMYNMRTTINNLLLTVN
jgi:hypothetical protein